MEHQVHYLISDAAKQVKVESHVLRYWEEELNIPIKRNELGHRYYTEADVKCFIEIKNLKEQGLQLKAIRMILKDGKLERLKENETIEDVLECTGKFKEAKADVSKTAEKEIKEEKENKRIAADKNKKEERTEKQMIEVIDREETAPVNIENREEKGMRLQMLLQHMICEAVKESNQGLCDDIKETVLKEMDYQFRLKEERDEQFYKERDEKENDHYKKIDELLRSYSKKGRKRERQADSGERKQTEENKDLSAKASAREKHGRFGVKSRRTAE